MKCLIKAIWWCTDLAGWIHSCLKSSSVGSPARRTSLRLQNSAGYVYRSIAELDRLTLPSGQMVLPGLDRER